MNCAKWLKIVLFFFILFLSAVVFFNFYLDTYGIRFSLLTPDKNNNANYITYATTINSHIFNSEYIFRNPDHFDSFIFGSSFTSVINPAKINTGKFYNMSYSIGLPAEHLAIIKAFLQKRIRIKSVIIGLDEFSFRISPKEHENQLLRIMHPYITGKSLLSIFYLYYFRTPQLFELANGKDRLLFGKQEDKFISDKNGLWLSWLNLEKKIIASGKPIFVHKAFTYNPFNYDKKLTNEVFTQIEEMIALSKKNKFSLIFFFNPIHSEEYLNCALGLIPIKERLASITDFYDFSGFNSVTTNNLNYYEDGHYRYLVGDIIIRRIFGCGNVVNVPKDFGVFVTKKNVNEHIKKQKMEMGKYLANENIN
jgi:hypothetical protein